MTPRLAEYIEAGKTLDADERLEAARQLLLSVERDADADRAEVAAAWDEVIERRSEEIIDGSATLIDGREGLARIRTELDSRRG